MQIIVDICDITEKIQLPLIIICYVKIINMIGGLSMCIFSLKCICSFLIMLFIIFYLRNN